MADPSGAFGPLWYLFFSVVGLRFGVRGCLRAQVLILRDKV